jgi:hypothetical protein
MTGALGLLTGKDAAPAIVQGAILQLQGLIGWHKEVKLILSLSREAEPNEIGGFPFCHLPAIDSTTAAGRLILGVMAQPQN